MRADTNVDLPVSDEEDVFLLIVDGKRNSSSLRDRLWASMARFDVRIASRESA